jgi:polyisoprenoid-binding protein YceI
MRVWFAILGAMVALAGPPGAAAAQLADLPAGSYRLEAARSSLQAVTGFFGGRDNVRLRFPAVSGQVEYDPAAAERSVVRLEVQSGVIQGDYPAATRAAAFSLEPRRFPVIRFMSRDFDLRRGGEGELTGDLTLHGVTRPVTLAVNVESDGRETRTLRFTGTGQIRRSDFGVRPPAPFARDHIELRFDVTFAPP